MPLHINDIMHTDVKLLSTFNDHYQKMPLCNKKCGKYIYTDIFTM